MLDPKNLVQKPRDSPEVTVEHMHDTLELEHSSRQRVHF